VSPETALSRAASIVGASPVSEMLTYQVRVRAGPESRTRVAERVSAIGMIRRFMVSLPLFQDHGLDPVDEVGGLHLYKVYTTGDGISGPVDPVPAYGVVTRRLVLIYKLGHPLPEDVVDGGLLFMTSRIL